MNFGACYILEVVNVGVLNKAVGPSVINKYSAVVLVVDKIVEEEILLLVSGVKVKCFASYCPRKMRLEKPTKWSSR